MINRKTSTTNKRWNGKIAFFIACFLVLTIPATPSSIDSLRFKAKFEYLYKYDGLLLSGLPTTSLYVSQTRKTCQVIIQAVDNSTLYFQLAGIKYESSSRQQTEEWTMMESLDQRELVSEYKKQLELPFRAVMIDGLCTGIVFTEKDREWSKNVKRSIINLISLRLSKPAVLEDSDVSSGEFDDHFRTALTESTIEGECQVNYTNIGKQEKTIVTKVINFDNCVTRPDIAYGIRYNFGCKECQNGNLVKPKTSFTYQFVGNEIEQSEVHSAYLFEAYGQVILKSETRSRLIFVEKRLIETNMEKIFGPKESLVYSIREDIDIEEFFKNGDDTETNPFNQTSSDSKIAELGNLVAMIPLVEKNTPETSNVVAEAVEIIRMFTIKDLKTMHSEIYIKSEKKIQVLIESILTIAGTKNTIQHLMHQIKNNTISPLRAAELLKSIQETQYPSSHIADLLIDLAHSSLAEQHESLRQSAWLAIGSIIRGFTSSNQERHLFRENSNQITKKYYRVLLKELENADSTYKKVLALKAFGNAGLDISINKLTQVIHDTRQQLSIRIEAVEALRLLSYNMVDQIQEILLESFQDDQYASELRSAALWRLMDTMPTESILDLIVAQMEHDSDRQVAAFTYQIVLHYSKSTDPCHSEFAVRCSDALAVTRYQPQPQLLSIMAQIPFLQNDLLYGIQLNFLTMFGKNAYLPKKVDVVLDSLFGGNWNKYAAQAGFYQHNFENEVIKSFEKLNTITKTTKWAHANSEEFGYQRTDDMKNMNNSFLNQSTDIKDAYAAVYFRYKNMDYACLPIDMETIENLVNKYDKYGQVDVDFLRSLFNRNNEFELHRAAFFLETTRKIPTTMGVPLTISKKIPTVFSVQGNIGFELELLRARITLDATPSIVSTHITEMRFMSPMFENAVKSLQTANIYTPLRIEVIAELKTDFKLSWKVVAPGDKKAIATFTTTPVILNRFATNAKKSYVEIEETVVDPQCQMNVEQIESFYEFFGINMVVRGNYSTQWTIAQVMLTEQDIQYTYENQNLPVEFAVSLNIGGIENAYSSEVKLDEIFEEGFNLEVPQTEPSFDYYGAIVHYIQSGAGFRHLIILKLKATQNFETTFELETVCDSKVSVCKWKLDCRRSPVWDESEKWTLNTKLVASRPHMSACRRQLRELENLEIHFVLNIKWGNNKKTEITINGKLEQSEEQKEYVRGLKREINGSPENKTLIKAINLNQLNIVSEYTSTQKIVFDRFFDYIKSFNYWTSLDLSDENKNKRVTVQFTVEPISRQFVNITIQTTQQSFELRNFQVPLLPLIPVPQSSSESLIVEKIKTRCRVSIFNHSHEKIYCTPFASSESRVMKLFIKVQDNAGVVHYSGQSQFDSQDTLEKLKEKISSVWLIDNEYQQLFFENGVELGGPANTSLQSYEIKQDSVIIVKHSHLPLWEEYNECVDYVLIKQMDQIANAKQAVKIIKSLVDSRFLSIYPLFNDIWMKNYFEVRSWADDSVVMMRIATEKYFRDLYDQNKKDKDSEFACYFRVRNARSYGTVTSTLAFVKIHGEDSMTEYNVKCHYNDPEGLKINWKPDIRELYCYTLLAQIRVGPHAHIIPSTAISDTKTSTYIATRPIDTFELLKNVTDRNTISVNVVVQLALLDVLLFLSLLYEQNGGRWAGTNNAAIVRFSMDDDVEIYSNIKNKILSTVELWQTEYIGGKKQHEDNSLLKIARHYLREWDLPSKFDLARGQLDPTNVLFQNIEGSTDELNEYIDIVKQNFKSLQSLLDSIAE